MTDGNGRECPMGMDPNECPEAMGIVIDSIRWDEDGNGEVRREWRPVCVSAAGACRATGAE